MYKIGQLNYKPITAYKYFPFEKIIVQLNLLITEVFSWSYRKGGLELYILTYTLLFSINQAQLFNSLTHKMILDYID